MLSPAVETPSWFISQMTDSKALVRLFCFPYAGGGSLIYRHWLKRLPPTIEICRAQLPGREGRLKEPPLSRLEPLILALSEAIRPYLDRPFAFFGHSMGGLISFELARRLQKTEGLMPVHLFISGCTAPHLPDRLPLIHNLPEPEFLKELRRLNGTAKEVLEHPELMRLMLPVIRADFEACQTYVYSPGPPLYCPITVFGGLQDHEATSPKLEAWRDQTTGPFSLHMLPGDHFFLHTSQPLILQVISQALRNSLA